MEDELIFKNFLKHISICHLEKHKLNSALLERQIGRKEIALHQGQICRKIYFVQSGSLRAFHINEDGNESTIMFAVCDWWITDMNCFANQKPAMLTIESRRLYKARDRRGDRLSNNIGSEDIRSIYLSRFSYKNCPIFLLRNIFSL